MKETIDSIQDEEFIKFIKFIKFVKFIKFEENSRTHSFLLTSNTLLIKKSFYHHVDLTLKDGGKGRSQEGIFHFPLSTFYFSVDRKNPF